MRAKNPELKDVKIPGGHDTVETGSIRINDDWKALYVRGDNAFGISMEIDAVLRFLEKEHGGNMELMKKGLYTHQLRGLRDIIANDVVETGKKN